MTSLIRVEDVSKRYCRSLTRSLYYSALDIGRTLVARPRCSTLRTGEFYALDHVSFELGQGESLGVVGHNGAGKTTLLRILCGIIAPDTGRVQVRGRLSPLLALEAGFNPMLTGRENVYDNCAMLGMTLRETHARFPDITAFADIGDDAMGAPVRTYSAGMTARLGFACAIHAEPDILLIDEVLAVGDLRFRMKCYRRLAALRQRGTSFIMVSHSPHALMSVTERTLYLSRGRGLLLGSTREVLERYENDALSNEQTTQGSLSGRGERIIRDVLFRDANGQPIVAPRSGEAVYLCVCCVVAPELSSVQLSVAVTDFSLESERVLFLSSAYDGVSLSVAAGAAELRVFFPHLGLRAGLYSARITVGVELLHPLDNLEAFIFRVQHDAGMYQNLYFQPRMWSAVMA